MPGDPILTMYRSPRGSGEDGMSQSLRKFARIDDRPLSQWYASFDWLVTVTANEALFGALARASEDGHAAAVDSNTAYLFSRESIRRARCSCLNSQSAISRHGMRVVVSMSSAGCRIEPEDVFIAYNATTREALYRSYVAKATIEMEGISPT